MNKHLMTLADLQKARAATIQELRHARASLEAVQAQRTVWAKDTSAHERRVRSLEVRLRDLDEQIAGRARNGTLCRICGERPRHQYKSELSPYCRECRAERDRALRQAKAKAPTPEPITSNSRELKRERRQAKDKAPTPPTRGRSENPQQTKPQRPDKAKAPKPKSERSISPERQAEIEATYRLMVEALERKRNG